MSESARQIAVLTPDSALASAIIMVSPLRTAVKMHIFDILLLKAE